MLNDATHLSEYFASCQSEPGTVRAALGPRIRQARLERLRGMNLELFGARIAELMGRKRSFSNVTISNWETGRQEPSFEALVAIARLTGLPLRYFAGVGQMDDYPRINWLDSEATANCQRLLGLLRLAAGFPECSRRLVEAQLKSLIDDCHRLGAGSGHPR